MDMPRNGFKHALAEGRQQFGLWVSLPSGTTAELLATCGYDWLLFDTEHAPGDPITVVAQLQAAAPYPVSTAVRVPWNDMVTMKRVLDAGALTVLVPYVQSAAEARAAVTAMRYPPAGLRGVAGLTRASRYGAVADYHRRAAEETCLLVQVETVEAVAEIEAIAAVEGVDGIFVGPADLAASMGHLGQPGHPEVKAAVLDAIRRIRAAGKPAGVLSVDKPFLRQCIEAGSLFTALDLDSAILLRGAKASLAEFREDR